LPVFPLTDQTQKLGRDEWNRVGNPPLLLMDVIDDLVKGEVLVLVGRDREAIERQVRIPRIVITSSRPS